jgi:hypothetical protein
MVCMPFLGQSVQACCAVAVSRYCRCSANQKHWLRGASTQLVATCRIHLLTLLQAALASRDEQARAA